jgi:hypothetical protein
VKPTTATILQKAGTNTVTVNRRFWIEILALSSGVACALALLLATFGAATAAEDTSPPDQASVTHAAAAQPNSTAAAQPNPPQEQTYEGMITDTHCGAKHEAAIGKTASDCTRACVHGGAQFALVNGDKIYILSGDLARLKLSAGQRSKIVGTLNGDTIAVSSITAGI